MKLKFSFLLLPVAFLTLLSLSNCRKEKTDCGETQHFVERAQMSESLRSKVPHTGRDTIVFFNQYGDTVVLRGTDAERFTIEKSHNIMRKGECLDVVHCFIDFLRLEYTQDTILSNTSKIFPIKTILMNFDSANGYVSLTGSRGGVAITTELVVYEAPYEYFESQYYTQPIIINNQTYNCVAFGVGYRVDALRHELYYNHYQGIVQLIENDTVTWNRLFNS